MRTGNTGGSDDTWFLFWALKANYKVHVRNFEINESVFRFYE
jgi:hypothetical protein